jgi:hypothetical protein
MINHNALRDRLTAVRHGQPIPPPPMAANEVQNTPKLPTNPMLSYKQFFVNEGYKFINVLAASVLYGYGIRAIFSTPWDFIGTLGVGFLLNHTLTILLKLLKK